MTRKEELSMGKQRGFTLIELLIVVVIIGILATIAIPKFSATREKAFLSTMKSDLKNLASQQEIYHNVSFSYGNTLAILGASGSDGVTITINEATGSGWAATASHAGLTAEHCGLYQGNAAVAGGDPGPAEGVIACTL
jgi:prepilin-type N-terminal cleavage/methylation domain-containing protein